jgi:DNA-binding LacI/PurR family transcriptional regulator
MEPTDPKAVTGTMGNARHIRRRMTLTEVAAALRLSPMTVSNAFNHPDRISPATRAHVLAAAERLGYAGLDPTARSLRSGRASAVGIVMEIRTVGILMPGEMGHALGQILHAGRIRVITCLQGRSARTVALATSAGIVDGGAW